jgi:colicin import membrane protein
MSREARSMLGPYAGSIVLHGAFLALFGVGWLTWQRVRSPTPPALAIEAFVADPRSLEVPTPAPRPIVREPPPEPVPTPAPEPDPAEAQRAAEAQRVEEQKRAEAQRLAAERQAAEEKRLADEKRQVDEKRREEEKRRADEKRAAEEDARKRVERERELQRSLAAEERERALRSSAAADWQALIRAKIEAAWIRPPTARAGLDCLVKVRQVPGGEVVAAQILSCNGDQAVRQSIENAVYRAAPLPPPPAGMPFERDLEVRFRPSE